MLQEGMSSAPPAIPQLLVTVWIASSVFQLVFLRPAVSCLFSAAAVLFFISPDTSAATAPSTCRRTVLPRKRTPTDPTQQIGTWTRTRTKAHLCCHLSEQCHQT
eukprot:4260272-Amphidinium_carterae.2